MPYLGEMSASNRGWIYEIEDVDKDEAIDYLMKEGISQDIAKKTVSCIGGRLVYLEGSASYQKGFEW